MNGTTKGAVLQGSAGGWREVVDLGLGLAPLAVATALWIGILVGVVAPLGAAVAAFEGRRPAIAAGAPAIDVTLAPVCANVRPGAECGPN